MVCLFVLLHLFNIPQTVKIVNSLPHTYPKPQLNHKRFQMLCLTYWGHVTHVCISKLGHHWFRWWLLPLQHQTINKTNAGLLVIQPSGTHFSAILMKYEYFPFKQMCLQMISVKYPPFCLSLHVLRWHRSFTVLLLVVDMCVLFTANKTNWIVYHSCATEKLKFVEVDYISTKNWHSSIPVNSALI